MGSLVLAGATSGSTTISPTDAVTVTCTLPSTGGTIQTSGAGFTTNGVAYASSTSALTTGSALTFNGTNLGIGTTNASPRLIVKQTSTNTHGIWVEGSANDTMLRMYCDGTTSGFSASYGSTGSYLPIAFLTSGSERMRITASGTLVLNPSGGSTIVPPIDIYGGTASSSAVGALRIGDSTYAAGPNNYWNIGRDNSFTGDFTFAANGTGKASINVSTGVYTAISDIRVKKNIVNLNYGLAEVLRLRPVMYNMITEEENVKQHIGFIAQEVKAVIDESVDDLIDESLQFYGLDKSVFVPVLVKAIQEQQALITAQSATITSLTERITALEGART